MGIVLVLIYIRGGGRGRPPLTASLASSRAGSPGSRARGTAASTIPSPFAPSFH